MTEDKYEHYKKPGRDREYVERECLTCGAIFTADGKFIRLCPTHRSGW